MFSLAKLLKQQGEDNSLKRLIIVTLPLVLTVLVLVPTRVVKGDDLRLRVTSPSFGAVVEKHVKAMLENKYAYKIAYSDLGHAHLITLPTNNKIYENPNDFANKTYALVYHVDETDLRWKTSKEPFDKKTPRTLVGFMDGTIKPAIDIIGLNNIMRKERFPPPEAYVEFGTVYAYELLPYLGSDLQNGDIEGFFEKADPVVVQGSKVCPLTYEIRLVPKVFGDFGAWGNKFDIQLTCHEVLPQWYKRSLMKK